MYLHPCDFYDDGHTSCSRKSDDFQFDCCGGLVFSCVLKKLLVASVLYYIYWKLGVAFLLHLAVRSHSPCTAARVKGSLKVPPFFSRCPVFPAQMRSPFVVSESRLRAESGFHLKSSW